MAIASLHSSGSNDAAETISIEVVDAAAGESSHIPRFIFMSGFSTMVLDLATVFYKAPHGTIFDGHRLAYYLVLAEIFVAGLAEVSAAIWLSRYGRGRRFLKAILCASMVPLVTVIALGGFAVVLKG